jgi:two-component sensor histidine kinase
MLDADLYHLGLGFKIIFGIVERSLHGKLELANNSGAVTRIWFKKDDRRINKGSNG